MSMKCHKNVNGIFVIWRETLKRVRFKIPNVLQFFTFSLDTTTTVLVLGAHSPPVSPFTAISNPAAKQGSNLQKSSLLEHFVVVN
jgi:hypothetical protein